MSEIEVYMAKFHRDKPLKNQYEFPAWLIPIQAGAAAAQEKTDAQESAVSQERTDGVRDDVGDNISHKNPNYCELTALYWIWKNRLNDENRAACDYYGLFHYRRWLAVSDADLKSIFDNNVDVVLPFPTIHEPDIRRHHERYVREADWTAMLQALKELEPEYFRAYERIFAQEYLYNYNILIAKAEVLRGYCEWLFPILERTEALSEPKGSERADRYIGYLGENLLTLYFMYHQERLNIVCTGRRMLT